jgi:integrase/recombinase XerD
MKTYLEPGDIHLLQNRADNIRDRLLIRLLFHLGCRVSEALGLTVDDIDFPASMVTIKHLKTRLKLSCSDCGTALARRHAFCPRCGKRVAEAVAKALEKHWQRTLPIDTDTMAMLHEFVQRGGPVVKEGKTLLFGINRHRAWQIITECAEKAGLPKLINPETGKIHNVSPHRLRDAFAVHAVKKNDSGDGLRMLQEHLGHASFNTTAKYRKVSGKEHREWYRNLWGDNE